MPVEEERDIGSVDPLEERRELLVVARVYLEERFGLHRATEHALVRCPCLKFLKEAWWHEVREDIDRVHSATISDPRVARAAVQSYFPPKR